MTGDTLPLSRPIRVADIGARGRDVLVVADEAERAALARDFDLVSIAALEARLHLVRRGREIVASGEVVATVTYACVLTLEPFDATITEAIEARFAEPDERARDAAPEIDLDAEGIDPPEPIVDGRIDPGALAAEYVALGLDPFPKKPGAVFEQPADPGAEDGPFAALKRLDKGG